VGSAAATVAVVALGVSCGEARPATTLPAMATTTTTTISLTTTTFIQVIYVVQPGDSLRAIADAYAVSMSSIMAFNNITNADVIDVGQEIRIPGGEVVVTELPTTTLPPPTT
jgi:LysM repeat protein